MRIFQREFTQLLRPFVASPCWYLYSATGAAFTSKSAQDGFAVANLGQRPRIMEIRKHER